MMMLPASVSLVSKDIFIFQKSRDLKTMKSPVLAKLLSSVMATQELPVQTSENIICSYEGT